MTEFTIASRSNSHCKVKMTPAIKKVARFDLWVDSVFDQRLRGEQDISLDVCPVRGVDKKAWSVLSGAHVYHVSAAKEIGRASCRERVSSPV